MARWIDVAAVIHQPRGGLLANELPGKADPVLRT
jgi:hypothetical protein